MRRRAAGRFAVLAGAARRRLLAFVAFAAGFDLDFVFNRDIDFDCFCARRGIVGDLSKKDILRRERF
jgi:hypothetical protein